MRLLRQPNVQIKVQLMRLAPVKLGEENEDGDWEWTGRFEYLTGTSSTCEVDSSYSTQQHHLPRDRAMSIL